MMFITEYMKKNFCIISVLILLLFFLFGCGEKDSVVFSDTEEIQRYLTDDPDGKEFFTTAGIISNTSYQLNGDAAFYSDVIDSSFRTFDITAPSDTYDFGSLGPLREGLAIVADNFFVTTQQILGTDTTSVSRVRRLTRYGYFLKLGDDSRSYLGWKLYGFNSLGTISAPVNINIATLDNSVSFFGDNRAYTINSKAFVIKYVKLADIKSIPKGESFTVLVNHTGSPTYYHLISAENNSGAYTEALNFVSSSQYLDTVDSKAVNVKLWNLVTIQTFKQDSILANIEEIWTIPYKAAP